MTKRVTSCSDSNVAGSPQRGCTAPNDRLHLQVRGFHGLEIGRSYLNSPGTVIDGVAS